MYLLKQFCIATSIRTVATFTFHHVSIKTVYDVRNGSYRYTFTFHHVSIKTVGLFDEEKINETFTFHHVSIKTGIEDVQEAREKLIHIPPCIY